MPKFETVKKINLTGLQIKSRLETVLSYDHKKYEGFSILFENKRDDNKKLPFCDYKVSIVEELRDHRALQENINKLLTYKYQESIYKKQLKIYQEYVKQAKLLAYKKQEEEKKALEALTLKETVVEEKVIEPVAPVEKVTVVEEVKQEAIKPVKKTTPKKKTTTKKVDSAAIVEKIKQESREKNKGKKKIGRREINKMLDPFGLKAKMRKDLGPTANDDVTTSIDVYLSAIDKASANATNSKKDKFVGLHNTQELNISDILKDIDDKNK